MPTSRYLINRRNPLLSGKDKQNAAHALWKSKSFRTDPDGLEVWMRPTAGEIQNRPMKRQRTLFEGGFAVKNKKQRITPNERLATSDIGSSLSVQV
jgi:hypothetical protein